MKVVHICTQIEHGGAAQATVNLHLGLRRLGVESTLLSLSESSVIPYCEHYPYPEAYHSALSEVSLVLVWKHRTEISNTHFSIDLFGCNIADHPLVREADVIHLHWVAGFLSSISVAELAVLGKPLFWTVHDMRPLTGGCHFSAKCNRFAEACGECPQLKDEPLDFTTRNLSAMSAAVALAKPVFIAPSQWMLRNIRRSRVSRESVSYCIPYGIDSRHFRALEKVACRSELNLQKDAWYILLVTSGFRELRKGMDHALSILNGIKQHPAVTEAIATGKIRILCCGTDANNFTLKGWQIDRLGHVQAKKMPLIYNSADVLLFTSLDDNLPNVLLEAMACGIPVVSHRVGGTIDLLSSNPPAGRLFPVGNTADAIASVIELFQNTGLHQQLSSHAIEKIRCEYSLEKQASAYLQLYTNPDTQSQTQPHFVPMPLLREGSSEALPLAIRRIKARNDRLNHRISNPENSTSKSQTHLNEKRNGRNKKFAEFVVSHMKHWYLKYFHLRARLKRHSRQI